MYNAIVIGCGVVGALVARELSLCGMSVCILEAENDVSKGATKANSAIVHAGFDAKEGTLKARLNVRGSEIMPKVTSELGVKYKNNGTIVVGFDEEDKRTLLALKERGERNGVKGLRVIGREELLYIEKNIGENVKYALHAPTGAIVCPYELCIAAVGNAMDNGAELIRSFKVDKIEKQESGYRVYSGDKSVLGEYVINCAGVYADEVARLVGDDSFSIHARKGEYMLLDKECGGHVSHTVFRCPSKMGKGVLVTPTVDGNLLLGPTAVDIEDKSDTSVRAEGLEAIRIAAGEQVSGINFAKVITSFAGNRATGSSGDFIIGFAREKFINCAGIESPGLSSAPAIAEYVRELLSLERVEGKKTTRLSMHWFSELSIEEKNEVIKSEPEYARIICRCEKVSEGEILYAIRTNPRPLDLDGVKRRTRSTMGRCQGGFCSPYIVKLLSRELGVDFEEVKKSGARSYINLHKTKG